MKDNNESTRCFKFFLRNSWVSNLWFYCSVFVILVVGVFGYYNFYWWRRARGNRKINANNVASGSSKTGFQCMCTFYYCFQIWHYWIMCLYSCLDLWRICYMNHWAILIPLRWYLVLNVSLLLVIFQFYFFCFWLVELSLMCHVLICNFFGS